MLPLAFCDQAVDDPAIGIEATSASPTSKFCTSSGLCQMRSDCITRAMKPIGISKFASSPQASPRGRRRISFSSASSTPSPALKSKRPSITIGKLMPPQAVERIHKPGPGKKPARTYEATSSRMNRRCKKCESVSK